MYRLHFIDRLHPSSGSKSHARVLSFVLEVDALAMQTSSFICEALPDNVTDADFIVLVDDFGAQIFTGVITRITDNVTVEATTLTGAFADKTQFLSSPAAATAEAGIVEILTARFKNSTDPREAATFAGWVFSAATSTPGRLSANPNSPIIVASDAIYETFGRYGVCPKYSMSITGGAPSATFYRSQKPRVKLVDNSAAVIDITAITDIFETNKLIVYATPESGGAQRGVFYATASGISTNAADVTRLNRVSTAIVFSDDDINLIKAQNLRNNMYNHRLEATLRLGSAMYDFSDFELGQSFDIFTRGRYFDTALTGYTIEKPAELEVPDTVELVFGKARTRFTDKLKQATK